MAGVLAAGVLCGASAANAGVVVISDNFSGDKGGGNWLGDAVFTSFSPPGNSPRQASVDLYPHLLPGVAAVDLDGTTGSGNTPIAGELQSVTSLATGTYDVTFELASRNIAHPETTVVTIGGVSYDIAPPRNQPFTTYNYVFKNVSGHLSIADLGPSTQQGNFVTDIVVTAASTVTVPEMGTCAMMALGFAGLGFAAVRKTQTPFTIASIR